VLFRGRDRGRELKNVPTQRQIGSSSTEHVNDEKSYYYHYYVVLFDSLID